MKGALNDRFLLALLSLLLLAVLVFGYFIIEDNGTSFASGQNLTEQQKAKAIGIAMGDPIIEHEIQSMTDFNGGSYRVKGVVNPSQIQERSPGVNRSRILPAVEIVIGDENTKGMNLYAYVDPKENRVVYFGHGKRADIYGQLPQENRMNYTIAQTGYTPGQSLTGEQIAKAIKMVRDNKTVQDWMIGKNYTLAGGVIVTNAWLAGDDDSYYIGAYPYLSFTEGTTIYEPDFLIDALVDVNKGNVIIVETHVRTPVLREYSGNCT